MKRTSQSEMSLTTEEKVRKESAASDIKKKIWSFEGLLEVMQPTAEELEYRNEKLKQPDCLQTLAKLIKCSKCQTDIKIAIRQGKQIPTHPCLGVLMCQNCSDYYEDGEFSLDSDGEDKYCRWCGEGGTIFSCSKCICGFCAACIKQHFKIEYYRKVQKDENWLCFFCNPKPLWDHRFICSVAGQVSEYIEMKRLSNHSGEKSTAIKSGRVNTKKNVGGNSESKRSEIENQKRKKFIKTELRKQGSSLSANLNSKPNLNEENTSSDDESEFEIVPKKKRCYSPLIFNDFKEKDKDFFENSKTLVLKDLKKILQLSKHQMSLGIDWCSKMVGKIDKDDYVTSFEQLTKECQKVKWFMSVLSTYFVQFSNSAESIEKGLTRNEEQKSQQDASDKDELYTNISQFLNFMQNQVHVFKTYGVSLSDVMTLELYNDENIIGLRKNSKPLSISSCINTTSPRNDPESEKTSVECEMDKSTQEKELQKKLTDEKKNTDDPCKSECEDSGNTFSMVHESDEPSTLDSIEDIQKIFAILKNA